MTGNYSDYTLLHTDNPFEECKELFWGTLGTDEVLSKNFLEYLRDLMRRIDAGEEKLIPVNFKELLSIEKMLEDLDDGDV